ncbi:MAG: chitin disaccharide deacetylase [Firmicutes bacterium]|nr:chitin disaccharide deacetylase [Bacillota bacterium]
MKVIFNADDFGFSKGVNLGILEAYQNGPVRSATLMPGMPGFEHAVLLAKANPGLQTGVHLTLTAGNSVGGVYRTLTHGDGRFLRLAELERMAKSNEINPAEVEAEYEAQIQKVLSAGLKPSHFDSHHHTHTLPGMMAVFLKLAAKYGVKARMFDKKPLAGAYAGIRTADAFSGAFYGETATLAELCRILSAHGSAGSLEIMCHPAYVDHSLYASSSYSVRRAYELHVLTSAELMRFLEGHGITPCSFSDI